MIRSASSSLARPAVKLLFVLTLLTGAFLGLTSPAPASASDCQRGWSFANCPLQHPDGTITNVPVCCRPPQIAVCFTFGTTPAGGGCIDIDQ